MNCFVWSHAYSEFNITSWAKVNNMFVNIHTFHSNDLNFPFKIFKALTFTIESIIRRLTFLVSLRLFIQPKIIHNKEIERKFQHILNKFLLTLDFDLIDLFWTFYQQN